MRHTYQLSSRTGLHVCSCVVIPIYTPVKGLKLKLDTLWQLLTLRNSIDFCCTKGLPMIVAKTMFGNNGVSSCMRLDRKASEHM